MTRTQFGTLPESVFELPSSYYVSVEVRPVPAAPEPSIWDVVEWVDGPTHPGGWDAVDARLVGAVPAKEMGR